MRRKIVPAILVFYIVSIFIFYSVGVPPVYFIILGGGNYYEVEEGTVTKTVVKGYWKHLRSAPLVDGKIMVFQILGGNISYYDIAKKKVTNTSIIASLVQTSVGSNKIVSVIDEQYVSDDLNGDGDMDDAVIHFYDIAEETMTNTGINGIFPSISGDIIAFEKRELDYLQDLNGDGDMYDEIVYYYDIKEETLTVVAEGQDASISGDIIVFQTIEYYIGTRRDLNGDGDADDSVIRYYDITKKELTCIGEGQGHSISDNIIVFATYEEGGGWFGEIRYYDVEKKELVNTGVEIDEHSYIPQISGDIIAFRKDGWIHYYDVTKNSLVNTSTPGIPNGVTSFVVFGKPKWFWLMWVVIWSAIPSVFAVRYVLRTRGDYIVSELRKIFRARTRQGGIEKMVFNYIKMHEGKINISRCAKELGIAEGEVKEALSQLQKKGLVRRGGA